MVQGQHIDGVRIDDDSSNTTGHRLGFTVINNRTEYAHILRQVAQMAEASAHAFDCENETDAIEILFRIKDKLNAL